MKKRSSKWYNKNEKDLMQELGLTPTSRSGAGWIEKEDGYNEHIIAQLKSTDSNSYRLSLDDLNKLEYHALVDHKIPLFVLQFINRDTYFVIRKEDLEDIYNYLIKNIKPKESILSEVNLGANFTASENITRKKIVSNKKARDEFMKEREKQWEKKKK